MSDVWTFARLMTRHGEYVVTAQIPRHNPPAEIVLWGSRHFVLNGEGQYREGILALPIRAEANLKPDTPADANLQAGNNPRYGQSALGGVGVARQDDGRIGTNVGPANPTSFRA